MYLLQYTLTAPGETTKPIILDGSPTLKIENNGSNLVVVECQLREGGTWKSVALFNSQTIAVVPAMMESGFFEVDVEDFYAARFTLAEVSGTPTQLDVKVVTY